MNRIILAVGLLLLTGSLSAQTPAITLQVSNEQIALPFTRFTPFHPGLELGYRLPINENREWQVHAGGFYHEGIYTGIYLRAAHAWNYQPASFVQLQVAPGIGYMHTITESSLWTVNEDGVYEESGRAGQPHALAEVGLNTIFLPDAQVSPMLSYRMAVETPFATVFPVMFHNFLQLGVSVSLPSNL